jgi:hypothetical protein
MSSITWYNVLKVPPTDPLVKFFGESDSDPIFNFLRAVGAKGKSHQELIQILRASRYFRTTTGFTPPIECQLEVNYEAVESASGKVIVDLDSYWERVFSPPVEEPVPMPDVPSTPEHQLPSPLVETQIVNMIQVLVNRSEVLLERIQNVEKKACHTEEELLKKMEELRITAAPAPIVNSPAAVQRMSVPPTVGPTVSTPRGSNSSVAASSVGSSVSSMSQSKTSLLGDEFEIVGETVVSGKIFEVCRITGNANGVLFTVRADGQRVRISDAQRQKMTWYN